MACSPKRSVSHSSANEEGINAAVCSRSRFPSGGVQLSVGLTGLMDAHQGGNALAFDKAVAEGGPRSFRGHQDDAQIRTGCQPFVVDGKAMDEPHRAPVGHMASSSDQIGPWTSSGNAMITSSAGSPRPQADWLEAIGFREPSPGSAPGPTVTVAQHPQIQRMGSSLIAVAQDGDSESGGIGIWRTGGGGMGQMLLAEPASSPQFRFGSK